MAFSVALKFMELLMFIVATLLLQVVFFPIGFLCLVASGLLAYLVTGGNADATPPVASFIWLVGSACYAGLWMEGKVQPFRSFNDQTCNSCSKCHCIKHGKFLL